MKLTKVLTANQAKSMTTCTRRGQTVYYYGEKGDVYVLRPYIDIFTGEILWTCSCKDYQYRQARCDGQCKHGKAQRDG